MHGSSLNFLQMCSFDENALLCAANATCNATHNNNTNAHGGRGTSANEHFVPL